MTTLNESGLPNQVQILKIRPNPKPGAPTKAYADVLLYGLITIRGVALIASKNGSDYFIAFPSQPGKNGRFFPILEVSEPLRSEIQRLVERAARDAKLI